MLTLYQSRAGRGERPADLAEASLPKNVAWIGIEDLSEIETSSRLRHQNGAIYLSAPLVYRADSEIA